MKTFFAVVGFVVVALVVGTCVACNDEDDDRGLATVQLVSYHDGGGYDERPRCYDDEDCDDGYGQRYDQNYGSRDDRNRNRNRNRGAFSPGPFDRSPIDMRNACISLDCSGRSNDGRDRRDQPPPEEQPQSIGCFVPVPFHCDPKPEVQP